MAQFFLQGDLERQKGLPISPLFDRERQGITKSQVGFFDIVGEQSLWVVTWGQGITKSQVGFFDIVGEDGVAGDMKCQ